MQKVRAAMNPKRTMTTTTGIEARAKLLSGARQVFEAVKSTYGPGGNNVLYPDQVGDPILTRDGVTVARQMELKAGTPEAMGAQVVVKAASNTNKQAGDGTTLTVVLTYHLIDRANKLIAAGHSPIEVREKMQTASHAVLKFLEESAKDLPEEKLAQVATVSCGDAEIGKMIATTIAKVGKAGGITVEKSSIRGATVSIVQGFYFDAGFPTTASIERKLDNVMVLALDKVISSAAEILPILTYIHKADIKNALIVGELAGDALNNYIVNLRNAAYDGALVRAVGYGTERTEFLEDLALVTGGKVLRSGNVINEKTIAEYFGHAEKVKVTERNTTIIGGMGASEDINKKLAELQNDTDADDYRKELMQKRANRLSGKIAMVRVGGDSDLEADELKFRVDDAVQATKAAIEEGVVPGGGTMLVRASQIEGLDPTYALALQQPFLELMRNANQKADYRLEQVLRSKYGSGFNLRNISDEVVDLLEAGIVDPYKVIRLAVANATSTASNLITTNCIVHEAPNDDATSNTTSS